jgi:hypothetical protein
MRPWLLPGVLFASSQAVAVAAWLLPASIHIVSWSSGGPSRLALLPPGLRLFGFLGFGLLAAAVTWLWAHRDEGRTEQALATVAPLALLWLWAVPYVPWIPDRLPLVLVLSGPARWIVAVVAVLGVVRALGWGPEKGLSLDQLPGRRAVFLASLSLYVAFGLMQARAFGPGGDEPHYLIIIDSLLQDGDLQIENNHLRGDYRAYFRGGELRPDYLARGSNGAIYSVHAPGLPILLAPAYAVGGYLGAVSMMSLLGALTALAVFDLGLIFGGGRGFAWITWGGVCLSTPFMPYAWMLFPEMPGALLVAWAVLWLWRPSEQPMRVWLLRGLALSCMPWLHTKFSVLLAVFGVTLFVKLLRFPRLAASLSAPIALSGLAWLASFYLLYGTPDPLAPYGAWAAHDVVSANIPRGLLGLTFDQKFGLLFYAPIYAAAVVGCWVMLAKRETRFLGVALLLVTAVHVGSSTRLYMWWGGSSAPARFLVPILPCLAVMIAVALREARATATRAVFGVWLTISVAVGLVGASWPGRLFLFSEPHGRGRLVETLQAGSPLAFMYPTFTTEDWFTPLQALLPWLAAALASLSLTYFISRRAPDRTPFWLGVFASLAFLTASAAVTTRPAPDAREDAARRGALDVFWRYDEALRGFAYQGLARLTHGDILERTTVVDERSPAGPYVLPPGAYTARVWFAGGTRRDGEVVVSSSRTAVFGRVSGELGNPAVVPFEIPVAASRVMVTASGEGLTGAVVRTELIPRAIVPRSERPEVRARAIDSVPGTPGGYIVYTDQRAYPEGGVFWTRATEPATVLVAPGGASRIVLTLHLGPESGQVHVWFRGEETMVAVPANGTVQFEREVPPGFRLVPVTIRSPTTFVPAEVSRSDDSRQLGCQVRVELL